MKTAILFPGQGSQKVGMGSDLINHSDKIRDLFNKVNDLLGYKLTDIILNGPEEELNQTKNTQPAIITISVSLVILLQELLNNRNINFKPCACAGHSLGEFAALWYSGVITMEDLIKTVSIRGNLMQNAPEGSMVAALNLNYEDLNNFIQAFELKEKITIANYNSPTQYVISGEKNAIAIFTEKLKSLKCKAIILPVSGAFHSYLMEKPAIEFNTELNKLLKTEQEPKIPIYQNLDGNPSKEYHVIIEKIKKQMISPVLWTQTINNLVSDGVKAFIEVGPSKILTNLTKRITPKADCYNIFDINSLNEFIKIYEHRLSTSKSK